jgi:hypothetical protein
MQPARVTGPRAERRPEIYVDTLFYSPLVRNNFQFMYDNITAKPDGVEFVVCLDGKVSPDGTPVILQSLLPHVVYAAKDSILGYCPKSPHYVGRAHSHPPGSTCAMSKVDTTSFIKDTLAKMHAVICENRQMISYRKR